MNDATPEPQPADSTVPPKSKMTRIVLILIILLLAGFGLAFFAKPPPPEKISAPPPPTALAVTILTVQPQDIRETVSFSGHVEPWSQLLLASEQNGRIESLTANKGDRVQRGQLLLKLDDRLHVTTLRQQEVTLHQLDIDLARLVELQKSGSIAPSEAEALSTRRDLTRIALDQARLTVEKCSVTSSLTGRVLDRPVEIGEVINPGQVLFRIADIDRVKVVVDLPERDVFAVTAGTEVTFELDALPHQVLTGKVCYIASAAQPLSNTFRTEIEVSNPTELLKPGMIARIRIDRGLIAQALVIPLQALIPEKGQYIAYIVQNQKAVRRILKLKTIIDQQAVIAEGLQAGDQIVVVGQRRLDDGLPVVPVPEEPVAAAPAPEMK